MGEKKLFNRDFILLWLGQSVSQLGNGAGFIALIWWIQTTTGSAVALGTLAMVQTLVGVGVGPFAGAFVDRFDRKSIIILTDLIRGINYLVLGWLVYTGQLTMPLVYGIAAFNALCGQFFGPAISASIPQLVPDKFLEKANSLNQVTATMVNIVGFAVGGVIVAFLGVPMLLAVDGVSYILSAISELFIRIPKLAKEKAVLSAGLFIRDIKEGFVFVRKSPVLFRILQVAMLLNFFGAPFFILLPKFVNEHMGAGSEVYGYLLSAQMVGALIAIIILSSTSLIQKHLWIVRWSLVVQAAAYITLPFLPAAYWGIHISLFVFGGMMNAIVNIYFSTLMQRATPPEYMGKVFGLVGTMCQALQPASQGLTGIVAEFVRIPIIFTVSTAALGAGGFKFAAIPGLTGFLGGDSRETQAGAGEPAPATA